MEIDPITKAVMQAMDANARSTEWALESANAGLLAQIKVLEERLEKLEQRLRDVMEVNELWDGL